MEQYDHEKVVIIGGATHGMSSQLGQNANMAFINSYFLDTVLTNHSDNLELTLKYCTPQ